MSPWQKVFMSTVLLSHSSISNSRGSSLLQHTNVVLVCSPNDKIWFSTFALLRSPVPNSWILRIGWAPAGSKCNNIKYNLIIGCVVSAPYELGHHLLQEYGYQEDGMVLFIVSRNSQVPGSHPNFYNVQIRTLIENDIVGQTTTLQDIHDIWMTKARKGPSAFQGIRAVTNGPSTLLDSCEGLTCSGPRRTMVHICRRLNFSVMLDPGYNYQSLGNPSDLTALFIGGDSYVRGFRNVGKSFGPYIRVYEDYFLLYCEMGWITTAGSGSFSHWTSAFGRGTWIAIALSVLGVALISTRCKLTVFVPSLLDVIGLALREPLGHGNRFQGIHAIIAISYLALGLHYESVLTGELIAPPEPIVAQDLRELILDKGFKMLFPVLDIKHVVRFDHHEFKDAFQRVHLGDVFYQKLQGLDAQGTYKREALSNPTNKLATDVSEKDKEVELLDYGSSAWGKGKYCHLALGEPLFTRIHSTFFKGRGHQVLIRHLGLLREVGIEGMWYRGHAEWERYRSMRQFLRSSNAHQVLAKYTKKLVEAPPPLVLSEKLVQLFLIMGTLLGVAGVCLAVEILVGRGQFLHRWQYLYYNLKKLLSCN